MHKKWALVPSSTVLFVQEMTEHHEALAFISLPLFVYKNDSLQHQHGVGVLPTNMLAQPRINGLGTAVPANKFTQDEAKQFFTELFRESDLDVDRLSSVFDNACIDTRYSTEPLEWLRDKHSFEEKNNLYIQHATTIATEAAKRALADAEILPKDVHSIMVVSSAGIATPSLDTQLIQGLGLSRHVARKSLFGLGCAGGVNGISHAADYSRGNPGQNVLFVAVETSLLTFQRDDPSPTNFMSCSIFGDGAAAAVLNTWGKGPKFIGRHNTLLPDSEHILGWDIINSGLKVRISPDLPLVVMSHLPQMFEDACDRWGVSHHQIHNFILHPGGAKVVQGYRDAIDVTEKHLRHTSDILRNYGNMSSPTVLFVLDRFLREPPSTGEYGVMIGFGPGFSADQALFQW